jgi:hypothetical protein
MKNKEITMDTQEFTLATVEDVKKLKAFRTEKDQWSPHYERQYPTCYSVEVAENPVSTNLREDFGFPEALRVRAAVVSTQDYNHYYSYSYQNNYKYVLKPSATKQLRKLPMFVLVGYNNDGYRDRTGAVIKMNEKLSKLVATAKNPTFLGEAGADPYYYNNYDATLGSANVAVEVTHNNKTFILAMPFNVAERAFGLEITEDMKFRLANGEEGELTGWKDILSKLSVHNPYKWQEIISTFDFTYATLSAVEAKFGMGRKNLGVFLKALSKSQDWKITDPGNLSGIKKTWLRLVPVMNEVMVDNPVAFISYRSFAQHCNRSIEGVKIGAIFNEVFADVKTKEDFLKALREFYTGKDDGDLYRAKDRLEESIKKLPAYKEKRKSVLKTQATRAFAKIQQELENLTIDKKKHKLTWAADRRGQAGLSERSSARASSISCSTTTGICGRRCSSVVTGSRPSSSPTR